MADDPKTWIAIATSAFALAGTIYASLTASRNQRRLELLKAQLQTQQDERQARRETMKEAAKFRDPLTHAVYDLQSRFYNILRGQFLESYYVHGSLRERKYAVENTVFLIAQFLGWTEAVREWIQFLPLEQDERSKRLRQLQDAIYSEFQSNLREGFRIFAGEQRAIGELMIDRTAPTCRCIGYAAFVDNKDRSLDRWLDPLREDVKRMAADPAKFAPRLIRLQHLLIELLEFLDPDEIRFPVSSRTRVK